MTSLTIKLKGQYYTWFRYPKGELQVRLNDAGIKAVSEATTINVIADISSAEDIIHLALLYDAITACCNYDLIQDVNLIIPYLPYGRADRRFVKGDCNGFGVFLTMIENIGFTNIVTLDAHNPKVLAGLIREIKDVSPMSLIIRSIADFAYYANLSRQIVVLFPDEGAKKRYQIPELLGNVGKLEVKVLHCTKKRDAESGKFEGFEVPGKEDFPADVPVIIVDDICDGGGTFVGIAEALKDYNLTLGLYVTHGIFSKGFNELAKYFKRIYTTNSITRDDVDMLTIYDCSSYLLKGLNK